MNDQSNRNYKEINYLSIALGLWPVYMLLFLTFLVKAPTTIGISIPGIVAVVFDIP